MDIDNAMGDARRALDWEKQWECSIDPETAKAIRDAGLRLDIEAPVPGITSMSAAIDAWFAANKKK